MRPSSKGKSEELSTNSVYSAACYRFIVEAPSAILVSPGITAFSFPGILESETPGIPGNGRSGMESLVVTNYQVFIMLTFFLKVNIYYCLGLVLIS